MTKPKTLDQLRAEKERAETQLAIASYLVWKKYRLRSRACEEFLNRLNGM